MKSGCVVFPCSVGRSQIRPVFTWRSLLPGQGVTQNYSQAFNLYQRSAEQGNPYASYKMAKMYRDGIGVVSNAEHSESCFEQAFSGFCRLEAQSHDDKLQYCLGQMLHTGTGTGKDDRGGSMVGNGPHSLEM
ncbi:MAG: tetratricopeptide repeat protein [Enterocloster clostridioformis]